MAISLSSRDEALLGEAQQAFLSPLEHEDAAAWSRAVTEPVKRLLGAERGGIILPAGDLLLLPADGYGQDAVNSYPELTGEMQQRYRFLDRAVEVGAYDRAALWGPHLEAYHRSEYYRAYIVPNRFFDAVGLAEAVREPVCVSTTAQFILHRDREGGERDRERDLSLLRLLLPAFRAGVRAYLRFAAHRESFTRMIDEIGGAVLLCDPGGRIVHASPALQRMLASEPEREQLLEDARCMARRASARPQPADPPVREIDFSGVRHQLQAIRMDPELTGGGAAAMVCVRRLTPRQAPAESLRARFGLTHAEARVAHLLAEGESNAGIARTLSISPHTARHHTERILRKLGVHSRAEVAPRVLQA